MSDSLHARMHEQSRVPQRNRSFYILIGKLRTQHADGETERRVRPDPQPYTQKPREHIDRFLRVGPTASVRHNSDMKVKARWPYGH